MCSISRDDHAAVAEALEVAGRQEVEGCPDLQKQRSDCADEWWSKSAVYLFFFGCDRA